MPLRLSERTSSSRAASTISRFVLRRVSLRALRTKLSSITMFVLPINTVYTKYPECGVWGGKEERGRQEDGGEVESTKCKTGTRGTWRGYGLYPLPLIELPIEQSQGFHDPLVWFFLCCALGSLNKLVQFTDAAKRCNPLRRSHPDGPIFVKNQFLQYLPI